MLVVVLSVLYVVLGLIDIIGRWKCEHLGLLSQAILSI